MEWQKPSKEMADILAAAIEPFGAWKKMMFGCPVYTVNGNMFTGIHADHIFLRLPEAGRKEIAARFKQVAVFEPMKGRAMKEYVILPDSVYGDQALFRDWLKRSFDFASSLPPKKKPARRKS
jgi:TfoX/Sxy family transcriptional regulator of competence genes